MELKQLITTNDYLGVRPPMSVLVRFVNSLLSYPHSHLHWPWRWSLRWYWQTLFLLLWVLPAFLCLAQAVQVTDDQGQVLHLDKAPQRIVSILPSLAELVCALGQCQRLVGVDRYTNWPEQLQQLPQVGGGLDPNIEAIVSLRPDLVLASTSGRSAARLRSLGIPVLAFNPEHYTDVQRILKQLGLVLGVSNANAVWQDMDAKVTAIAKTLPKRVRAARVYFEAGSALYGASEASFIGEILTRLGAQNIVPADLGAFPKLSPEWVVRSNPDVIMVGQKGVQSLRQRPGWQGVRAVREQRICPFSTAEMDVLVRPGPRMAEAASLMARCLQEKAP